MTAAPKHRWFAHLQRVLSTFVLWRTLGTKGDMDARDVMLEFEAIRKRKAELDRRLYGENAPRRRWFEWLRR